MKRNFERRLLASNIRKELIEFYREDILQTQELIEEDLTRWYIHNEKSIGQYTGLKDKNGVEIYEGDICDCGDIYEIVFVNGGFFGRRYDEETPWLCPIVKSFEVIGNIYETPELLERS